MFYLKKSILLSIGFFVLFFVTAFAQNNSIDYNNPNNSFYRGYYKTCGKPNSSVKFHLCNQTKTLHDLELYTNKHNIDNASLERVKAILIPNYYQIIILLNEYERSQVSASFIQREFLKIANIINNKIDSPFTISDKIRKYWENPI